MNTVAAALERALDFASLYGIACEHGVDSMLDVPFAEWLSCSRLPLAVSNRIAMVAGKSRCGTLRASFTGTFWLAFTDKYGPEPAAASFRDLREWMRRECPLETVAPAGEIAAGMSKSALAAWAEQRGVTPHLRSSALAFVAAAGQRGRTWYYSTSSSTVGDVICAPVNKRRTVPEEVVAGALKWLRMHVLVVQRAREEENARVAAWVAPTDPALGAVFARLLEARALLRPRLGSIDMDPTHFGSPQLVDDPPMWMVGDRYCGLCSAVGTVRIHLQAVGERRMVECSCTRGEWPRCTLAVVAIDTLLAVLSSESVLRRSLTASIGAPAWERALADLDRLGPSPSVELVEMGWRLTFGPPLLLPIACKPKRKGGFTFSKYPGDAFRRSDAGCTLPADREVRELLLIDRPEPGRASPATFPGLLRLVGHPRVYIDKATEPTPVRRAALEMRWSALENGGVRLTFELGEAPIEVGDLQRFVQLAQGGWTAYPTGKSLLVFRVDDTLPRLLQILLARGDTFPAEAVEPLLARLPTLSRSLPARLPPTLRGESIQPDSRPVLRLDLLDGGALLVQALVRPLPRGPMYPPGEGPVDVHALLPEGRVYATRVLAGESEHVRMVLAGLPLPDEAEGAPHTWTLEDPDQGLELVAALQEASELVQVEWADVTRRRVTRPADASQLRMQVGVARDWFGLSGQVVVDGASVTLDAVLQAVLAGRRYVAAEGDTWIRLTDRFLEQLNGVAGAIQAGRGGLELPRLAAPLVEALAEAGAALEAPEGWRALIDRVRAAEGYEAAVPTALTADLRTYQQVGFQWLARLAEWSPGGCLADDMGLGKTVQALALLVHRADRGPALVVAPMSVGFNWLREAARFAPGLRMRAYRGEARKALLADVGPSDVLITSYDLLPRDAEALTKIQFATLVLDEAQAIKNATTARHKAAGAIQAEFRLALTGTPVENRIAELWSLYRVIVPGLLGSWEQFRARFAVAIEREGDAKRRAGLGRLIRPFLLRRLKAEVAKELPARTDVRVEVVLSPGERQLYDQARIALVAGLAADNGPAEHQRFKVLAAITRLRQLACHPRLLDPSSPLVSAKLSRLRELVAELREEGHRALVFSQFTKHLALVREALTEDGVTLRYLDGSTPEAQRRAEVDAFQAGEGEVFLISLKAGGTGLNLTAATYVIHMDPWWNPAVEDQASDRAHRIGQTQPVTVYRLVTRGTIEEGILALHAEKRDLVAGLLDGTGAAATLGTNELVELLQGGGDDGDEAEGLEGVAESLRREAAVPAVVRVPVERAALTLVPPLTPVPPLTLVPPVAEGERVWFDAMIARVMASFSAPGSRLLTPSAVVMYRRSVERFAEWVSRTNRPPSTYPELCEAADAWLQEVRNTEPARIAVPRAAMTRLRSLPWTGGG